MNTPDFDPVFREKLSLLFQWRRDVRHFRKDPIDERVLDDLLHMTALAPSVGLSQPWRFARVDDPSRRAQVIEEFERTNAKALSLYKDEDAARYASLKLSGMREAPHHIAVFSEKNPSQGKGLGRQSMPETAAYSTVMAIYTFWLAARALDIGVGWVSILDPVAMHRILDADPDWMFVAYLCVGYPQIHDDTPELERKGWESRNPERSKWIQR